MALIKVGIHENLMLSDKTVINDKGTLELSIKSVEDPNALLNAFESNSTFTAMESSFRFYPPSMKDFNQVTKSSAEVAAEILKLRHQLLTYARLYAPKEEVDAALGGLAMFKGLGIADDKIKAALAMFDKEDFVHTVVTNLCTLFVSFLKSKNAFSGKVLFRHKFLRQSKTKNYAVIPTSDFDVWIESMDVPKDASKVEFSAWEIKEGKHLDNPVSSDASAATVDDANRAKDLFAPAAATEESKDESTNTGQPDLFAKQE
jgi:hypothetical protein